MSYRYANLPIEQVRPNAKNTRTHSKKQIRQIATSIRELGFAAPVLVDEYDVLIAGHGRLEAARSLGMASIPAIILDGLSEAKKRALMLADNRIAQSAGWDREQLSIELAALPELLIEEGIDVGITGFEPAEIDRVTRPLGARDHQVGPHAEAVGALDGRELELPRQLASARLGRGEHGRLVQQRARVGSLSCRLEVDDDRILRQVVEQRRSRGIEVGGVKLDARKCGAGAQARQLVLPIRADVPAQALERNRFAKSRDGGGASLRSNQELAPRPDGHVRDRHYGTLVVRVEQAQRLHRVADPLGPHGRIGRRGKHVEDAAAQ